MPLIQGKEDEREIVKEQVLNNKLNERGRFRLQHRHWLRHSALRPTVSNHRLGESHGHQSDSLTGLNRTSTLVRILVLFAVSSTVHFGSLLNHYLLLRTAHNEATILWRCHNHLNLFTFTLPTNHRSASKSKTGSADCCLSPRVTLFYKSEYAGKRKWTYIVRKR